MRKHLDWVVILYKTARESSHAKGLKVCHKLADVWEDSDGEHISEVYKYGDFNVWPDQIEREWSLTEMPVKWVDFVQDYKPTLKEKLMKRFFHKDYPSTVKVRPDDDTIIVMNYRSDHMEIAEYSHRSWITDLWFPAEPQRWAYIPQECIAAAEQLIEANKNK